MTYRPVWPTRRNKMKSRPAHCHFSDEQMKPQYVLQDDDPMGDSDAPDAEAKSTKPTRVDELVQPRIKQSVEPTGLDTTKLKDDNAEVWRREVKRRTRLKAEGIEMDCDINLWENN